MAMVSPLELGEAVRVAARMREHPAGPSDVA